MVLLYGAAFVPVFSTALAQEASGINERALRRDFERVCLPKSAAYSRKACRQFGAELTRREKQYLETYYLTGSPRDQQEAPAYFVDAKVIGSYTFEGRAQAKHETFGITRWTYSIFHQWCNDAEARQLIRSCANSRPEVTDTQGVWAFVGEISRNREWLLNDTESRLRYQAQFRGEILGAGLSCEPIVQVLVYPQLERAPSFKVERSDANC